jgi:hypothetical protein
MADQWATGGRGGPRSRDGRAGLSCAEQRRGRHGGEEGPNLWGRGVSEGKAGATHERSCWRAGPGCRGGRAARAAAALLGRCGSGVREGRAGRQGRKKRERVGRPTGFGLGFRFGFPLFYFLFQTPLKLKPFEFKFKFEFNPSTQTKRTMHQHECNNKF